MAAVQAWECQFEIIGESLNRLGHVDPETADRIADLPRIVAFRNVFIHGYATIDDASSGRSRPNASPDW